MSSTVDPDDRWTGSGDDVANGLAVDAAGAAYITGSTTSKDFPLAQPLQHASTDQNVFVARITNPTGITLSGSPFTWSVSLSWVDNGTNQSGYTIERKNGPGAYATVGTIGADLRAFTDAGLDAATSYTYRVVPTGAKNDVGASNEVVVKTNAARIGDVNGDGKINVEDAILILGSITGKSTLTAQQKAVADTNGDGKINVADAIKVLRIAVGLEKAPA